MENKIGIHCFISGRVQGVWFRASTQDEALTRGLTGWVRNCTDGRVEVMAFGDRAKIMELYEWLKKGPERANVESVTYEEMDWQIFERFSVL